MFNKRKSLTVHDIGQLIQRFLSDRLRYPQEWNDFVDAKQRRPESERRYRWRCYELDPSVNRPGKVDEAALTELWTLAAYRRCNIVTCDRLAIALLNSEVQARSLRQAVRPRSHDPHGIGSCRCFARRTRTGRRATVRWRQHSYRRNRQG